MNLLPPLKQTRLFFAVALIGLGVLHFIFDDFVTGRPPHWPEGWPGQEFVAYVSGAIIILAGIAILSNQMIQLLLFITGSLILLWSGVRNLTSLVDTLDYGILLTTTNKALTFGFGTFLVASTFHPDEKRVDVGKKLIDHLAPIARYTAGFFLLASGVQHFLFVDFIKFLIPAWIPAAEFWVYFSGIALVAGGLGILTGVNGKLAALLSGWMVFTWLVVLHIPRAISTTQGAGNEWMGVFEALAVSCILFILTRSFK